MTSELMPRESAKGPRGRLQATRFLESEHHPIRTPRPSLRALRGETNNPWEELLGQARANPSPGEQTTAQSKGKPETEQNICCIPVEGSNTGDARWGGAGAPLLPAYRPFSVCFVCGCN